MTLIGIIFLGFHVLSYIIYQNMINSYIVKVVNLIDGNAVLNADRKEEVLEKENKEEKQEKSKKNKKGKKKKKSKKKKTEKEAQFPPKKSKRKTKMNIDDKAGAESSKNDIADIKENNLENITRNKNGIVVAPNNIANDKNNKNKINGEKIIFTSKDGLDNIKDEKKENNGGPILDINKLNDQEINTLKYEDALKIDKRTYFQYYWSLSKKKHLILFTFYPANDYNVFAIKVSLFFLSFGLYFTINGFFFTDSTMHKLYEDKGKYNIVFRIPQILFSTIISAVINVLLKQLSLTEANILSLKEEKDSKKLLEKSHSIKRNLRIKFLIYFVISIVFMLFFWYFISCFCAVYTNTQIVLIKDTLVSYALSMVYPFGLNLLPGLFRIPALRAEKGDKSYMYKISLYVALI